MKIIYKLLLIVSSIIIILLFFLSFYGIETKSFNNQISKKIKNINKDLEIDLKEVKLVLDPFKFKINVKTVGSRLINKGKIIEIENIKTQISLRSILENKFLIKNLEISTKSIEINDLISFSRSFNKSPELFILEKIIKKGYLVADIKLEFDQTGKIKDNYLVKGFIKDTKLGFFEKYYVEKLDLIFNYQKNSLSLGDILISFNSIKLSSKKISIKSINKEFLLEGHLDQKKAEFNQNQIELFIKTLLPNIDIKKANLSSKNKFSFKINKEFRIENFKLNSDILINEIELLDNLNIKNIFPNSTNKIRFSNNKLKVVYQKKDFSITGNGNILFQENEDYIKYKIDKKNKVIQFKTSLIIKNNPLEIDFLNYKNNRTFDTSINLEGTSIKNDKIMIKSLSLNENQNKIEVKNLIFDKKFKIIDFKNINLNYLDIEKKLNSIEIYKKNKEFFLEGPFFNVNHIIENLLSDDEKNLDLINIDKKINININKINLDENYDLDQFNGYLLFDNQKLSSANLKGNFSDGKKFKFTIKSNNNTKTTTLYLAKAEPIVGRYKFIKGFSEGELDLSSSKKLNESISTLKIYNFKLKKLPLLTKILTLASLQGVADILSGEGISFDEFEMNFRNKENLMTIDEIYAIGPSISILMDGYIDKNKLISLRGTLVPATTINKFIGSLPVLGKILVGSKTGEGVFGVSFKIKGPPKNVETTVNPIKTLTPRFITRTLEKIKKN